MDDSPLPLPPPPTVDTKPIVPSPKRSRSIASSERSEEGRSGSGSNLPAEEEPLPQVSSAFDEQEEPKEKKPKKARKSTARSNSRVLNCNNCREKKMRCDRLNPCSNCSLRSIPCEWVNAAPAKDGPTPLRQNAFEITRLRREVSVLVSRLGLTQEEIDALHDEASRIVKEEKDALRGGVTLDPNQSTSPSPSPYPRPRPRHLPSSSASGSSSAHASPHNPRLPPPHPRAQVPKPKPAPLAQKFQRRSTMTAWEKWRAEEPMEDEDDEAHPRGGEETVSSLYAGPGYNPRQTKPYDYPSASAASTSSTSGWAPPYAPPRARRSASPPKTYTSFAPPPTRPSPTAVSSPPADGTKAQIYLPPIRNAPAFQQSAARETGPAVALPSIRKWFPEDGDERDAEGEREE